MSYADLTMFLLENFEERTPVMAEVFGPVSHDLRTAYIAAGYLTPISCSPGTFNGA